ncbi:DUF488 domain-containing protein [Candidatus Berkiella aquae]|uniref:DUF488 family protein n=1 Tax=Candidatus Berkiella aquae TaxID=295108 RepID=A0A0Q9YU36_9GAMM|nr:DUF488 family protein [Candidatus Berkiella aquae]MCS5712267.1 DUF488 family protein [Candidatus Berkiella aquae]
MKPIKVKRAYDPVARTDGFRVLVDRLWPRGLKKEEAEIQLWLKEIAPSTELRKWYDHDPKKWTEFQKRYVKELSTKEALIDIILKEAMKKTVTLLFSSKELERNNAVALQKILLKRK